MDRLKIAVDCRMLGKSGIGVYLENILQELIAMSPHHTFLLIGKQENISCLFKDNPRCDILPCSIPVFSKDEFLKFPVKEINRCDAYYTPNFNIPRGIKIPIYSTIHDVVFLDIKTTPWWNRFISKYMLRRAIRLSSGIFTVSKFSKERILYHFPTKKEIYITYNGISNQLKKCTIPPNSPYPFDYILYVGNIKKHKGLNILLDGFDKALEKGFNKKLVIIGNAENFRTKDKSTIAFLRERHQDIIFTGRVSDEVLYNTIAHAHCLVQPSLYEGFGIPPLEALYFGVPAIVSDIPVFKEIYNDLPVCFFPSGNKEIFVEKLMTLQEINIPIKQLRDKINFHFNYANSAAIIYKILIKAT
jgi:glycosyltransferase involved in cell wall biosynthesis